jgi:hypothetical protein
VAPWDAVERNPHIWHFAFHAVPELPEKLVAGNERAYFDFFYDAIARQATSMHTCAAFGTRGCERSAVASSRAAVTSRRTSGRPRCRAPSRVSGAPALIRARVFLVLDPLLQPDTTAENAVSSLAPGDS